MPWPLPRFPEPMCKGSRDPFEQGEWLQITQRQAFAAGGAFGGLQDKVRPAGDFFRPSVTARALNTGFFSAVVTVSNLQRAESRCLESTPIA